MGLTIPHPPALCNLISKGEAARFHGQPVGNGESAGPISGCAYRSATDANTGLLVTRGAGDDGYPPAISKHYAVLDGIGEKAYTDYTDGLGFEATTGAQTVAHRDESVILSVRRSRAKTTRSSVLARLSPLSRRRMRHSHGGSTYSR